jgi:hypothetical protein
MLGVWAGIGVSVFYHRHGVEAIDEVFYGLIVSFPVCTFHSIMSYHINRLQPTSRPRNYAEYPTQRSHPHQPQRRTDNHIPHHHVVVPLPIPKHLAAHVFVARIDVTQVAHRGGREVVLCKAGIARDYSEQKG